MSRLASLSGLYNEEKAQELLALFPLLTDLEWPVFPHLTMDYHGVHLYFETSGLSQDGLARLIAIVNDAGMRLDCSGGQFSIWHPEDYQRWRHFEETRAE